jgi:hypothetical protein
MNELIEFIKTYKLIHNSQGEWYFEPKTTNLEENDYWKINIPKGLTEEQAYQDCLKLFPCWRGYDNFDGMESDRTSNKAYSIKVKANVEADENLKNLSADDLKEKGIKGITLLERLVLEKDYFLKTGKHLDINNVTACTGSRYSDGHVPYVDWNDDRLKVYWYSVDNRYPHWRSREVV